MRIANAFGEKSIHQNAGNEMASDRGDDPDRADRHADPGVFPAERSHQIFGNPCRKAVGHHANGAKSAEVTDEEPQVGPQIGAPPARSEERRVGKEWVRTCRYRGGQDLEKKTQITKTN